MKAPSLTARNRHTRPPLSRVLAPLGRRRDANVGAGCRCDGQPAPLRGGWPRRASPVATMWLPARPRLSGSSRMGEMRCCCGWRAGISAGGSGRVGTDSRSGSRDGSRAHLGFCTYGFLVALRAGASALPRARTPTLSDGAHGSGRYARALGREVAPACSGCRPASVPTNARFAGGLEAGDSPCACGSAFRAATRSLRQATARRRASRTPPCVGRRVAGVAGPSLGAWGGGRERGICATPPPPARPCSQEPHEDGEEHQENYIGHEAGCGLEAAEGPGGHGEVAADGGAVRADRGGPPGHGGEEEPHGAADVGQGSVRRHQLERGALLARDVRRGGGGGCIVRGAGREGPGAAATL